MDYDSLHDMKHYLNGDAFQDYRVDRIGIDFMTNRPVYITNHVGYEELIPLDALSPDIWKKWA